MVKLAEGPDSGFCDMNGRGVEVGCKNDQMPVTSPFDRTNSLSLAVKAWMERIEKSASLQ